MKNNKYYRVYAEINLDAIVKNVDNLMALTKENTGALAVVKADGYGHGDVAVAKAVAQKVTGYAVATLDEAVNLRENGVKKPILVLGYVDPYEFDILVSHEITATVFDVETAQLLADAARVQKKQAHCHIKVDTGMRRIGLEPDENGIAIVKQITALKELSADGIFTHFAASDETDKTSAEHQFKLFTDFTGRLEKEGIHFTYRHCANSAAVIDMPQVDLDMVRLGIAMYGMYPSDEVKKEKVELFPALDLKSHVTMVKEIPAGEKVTKVEINLSTSKKQIGKWQGAFGSSTSVAPDYWTQSEDMEQTISGKTGSIVWDVDSATSAIIQTQYGGELKFGVWWIDCNKFTIDSITVYTDAYNGSGQITTTVSTTKATTNKTTASTTTTTKQTTTATNGPKPSVKASLYGDVNLDGRVDITDAVLLNKKVAGVVILNDQQYANADCCTDDGVGQADSTVLLQFLVSIVRTLPAEG